MNPFTDQELKAVVEGVVEGVLERVKRELGPIFARLDTIEKRPELRYCGPYRAGDGYSPGCFVTKAGGLWLCERATSGIPGHGDSGWRLVVKEGRAS